jgi:hypothetical protein
MNQMILAFVGLKLHKFFRFSPSILRGLIICAHPFNGSQGLEKSLVMKQAYGWSGLIFIMTSHVQG